MKPKFYSESFLLRLTPIQIKNARRVAKNKGVTLSEFIRLSLTRSITYHDKVEYKVYQSFIEAANEAEPVMPFFDRAFNDLP